MEDTRINFKINSRIYFFRSLDLRINTELRMI